MEKVITPLTINMRTLREAQNISAKEMAQYLGKAITTYRNYEAGFYPVPKELVGPIAERLGVTQEELLGGTPLPTSTERKKKEEQAALDKERRMQEAQLAIKQRFGKNAILKGLNFEEGATAKERNAQIGGHKA